jgi:hypothetical protein
MSFQFRRLGYLLFVHGLFGCGSGQLPDERVGEASSPLTLSSSLSNENAVTVPDALSVDTATLENIDGGAYQGTQFVLALKQSSSVLKVQVRTLDDTEASLGTMDLQSEWTGSVSSMSRLRVAAFGMSTFAVATREAGQLKIRSFMLDDNGEIQLKATVASGETIDELAISRVYQGDPNLFQLATVVTTSSGTSKVIVWEVDETTGAITRRGSATDAAAVKVGASSLARPWGVLATPLVLASSNDLSLVAWEVTAAGAVTKKSSLLEAADITSLSATKAGYRQIAVGSNYGSGAGAKLELFKIDASWNISKVDESDLGTGSDDPRDLIVTAGGGSRVYMAGTTGSGSTTVRVFETMEGVRHVDAAFASAPNALGGATALRGDRLATASVASDGTVVLRAWRDYHMPLVRGSYVGPANPGGTPGDNPATFSFTPPFVNSPENLVAAGRRFALACSTGACQFYDKAGNNIGSVSDGDLFAPLQTSLRSHLEEQHACDPELGTDSDVETALNQCPKTASAYDSRVLYSASHDRFVIVSHLRYKPNISRSRYLAFAVSVSEDPRDGFNVFANTESLIRDDPKAGIAGGMLLLSFDGANDARTKPAAMIYDMDDLAGNVPFISSTKLTFQQGGRGNNHFPLLASPPRVVPQPAPQPPLVVDSDLALMTEPGAQTIYAFWKDVEGPVNMYTSLPRVTSGNNTDYDTAYSVETSPGNFSSTLYHVGRSGGQLQVQRVLMTLQKGVGFTSTTASQRDIPCANCTRPTAATFADKTLVAFHRDQTPGQGGSAEYAYLSAFNATPVFGVAQVGTSTLPTATFAQNMNAVVDGTKIGSITPSTPLSFWMMHLYSSGTNYKPVVARVVP